MKFKIISLLCALAIAVNLPLFAMEEDDIEMDSMPNLYEEEVPVASGRPHCFDMDREDQAAHLEDLKKKVRDGTVNRAQLASTYRNQATQLDKEIVGLNDELLKTASTDDGAKAAALIDAGANVNYLRKNEGERGRLWDRTPLSAAAVAGKPAMFQLLLRRGASPASTRGIVFAAVVGGNTAVMDQIIKRNFNVNKIEGDLKVRYAGKLRFYSSCSPLHLAVIQGNVEM